WKKGDRYGVILTDHISGRPIDLLAERSREAVIECLKEHPGLEVISRDRMGLFADAARQAAPQAVQVADRWHLVKNVGDLVDQILGFAPISLPIARNDGRTLSTEVVEEADVKTST